MIFSPTCWVTGVSKFRQYFETARAETVSYIHHRSVDLDAEEKENRISAMESLPFEKLSEASRSRQKSEHTVSTGGSDERKAQTPFHLNISEGITEQSEQPLNASTSTRSEIPTLIKVEAHSGSLAQLTSSEREISTVYQFHRPELNTIPPVHERNRIFEYNAEEPVVIDITQENGQSHLPQENRQTIVDVVGAPSPKRRRLESKEDASSTSNRNISFDLGTAQPCAASSAIKSKPPSQTPKLEILHQSQLSLVQKPPRPNRRRGKACRLLVDEVCQLSKPQMLENFRKERETLQTRTELLAPGASMMHPRRIRSFYTDRLLALPANFELSICKTLAEVWRFKRQQCELGRLDEDYIPPRPPSSIQHSRSNLPSIRESGMESSREMARGGLSEISLGPLAPRVSSFDLQDRSTEEKRSLVAPTATQSVTIPEEEAAQKPEEVNLETTLKPTEILAPEINREMEIIEVPSPSKPFPGIPDFYANDTTLWTTVKEVLKSDSAVEFSRLISPRTSRKQAAKTFHHLLCLLKKRRIRVAQAAAFEPIFISLAES